MLAIIIASILWGVGFYVNKLIVTEVPASVLNFIGATSSALIIFFLPSFSWPEFKKHIFSYPVRFLFLGLFGVSLALTFTYLALERLDLGVTTATRRVEPIFTVIVAAFVIGEFLTVKKYIFLVIGVASCLLLLAPAGSIELLPYLDWVGVSYVMTASACMSVSAVIGRSLAQKEHIKPIELAFARLAVGALLLFVYLLVTAHNQPLELTSYSDVAVIFLRALIITVPGFLLYYHGLQTVKAGIASVLEFFSPMTSVMIGIVFLGEQLNIFQWIAFLVLMISVLMVARGK